MCIIYICNMSSVYVLVYSKQNTPKIMLPHLVLLIFTFPSVVPPPPMQRCRIRRGGNLKKKTFLWVEHVTLFVNRIQYPETNIAPENGWLED